MTARTLTVLVLVLAGAVALAAAGCTVPLDDLVPAPHPSRGSGSASGSNLRGTVTRVADGDTVTLRSQEGQTVKVRVLGIDAPEIAHGNQPADCGGREAAQFLRDFALKRQAVLVTDPDADSSDRFGRRLGYLEVDDVDAGRKLLEAGLVEAWRPKSAPKPSRWDDYVATQRQAERAGRGSWTVCHTLGRP